MLHASVRTPEERAWGRGGALMHWKKIKQPSTVKTNTQIVLPLDLTFQQKIRHFSLLLAVKLIGI